MPFRQAASALLLAAYLSACTSYRATTQPLAELTAPPKPAQHIRVTLEDGDRVLVDVPEVVNDTLHGYDSRALGEKVTIPVSDIRDVELVGTSAGKTLGMFGIVVAVLAVAAGAVLLFASS